MARAGIDVLVIEKGIVGWEASGRNGGGCSHHFSPLFAEEQRLWPEMDALLGYPTEFRRGRIKVAHTEGQLAGFSKACDNAARAGFASEPLDHRQLQELVPIAGDAARGAFLWHWGGHANPQRTLQAYAWALQDHGGRILQHTTVTGIDIAGGRAIAVETTAGRFGCDQLVIAAGPHSGALARMVGADLPLTPARAEIVVTEAIPLLPHGGVDGNGL